ncbi:MAG: aminotransferase class I/II-fold pyridoxal phosphate-dependent enzyme [Clostridia bacterium]|nr:aminotransferase class I/II-fold pyridoxal phosphate-dependent enzyme [Clostridia bacterium]
MQKYSEMTNEELQNEFSNVKKEFEDLKALNLSLDMSRGKPGSDNLDISNEMLELVNNNTDFTMENGADIRNYGGLDGIPEMKKLFADIFGVPNKNVIVGGNASLTMMFDTVAQGMTHGLGGKPWLFEEKRKFLCPAPGYDRHFAIVEHFGFELITIPMTESGPNMDMVEEYVKDETVKGIWCVPKYSNPDGITYSDETVRRFAKLKPAAKDFHIFWDNAYVVHDLYDEGDTLLNLFEECKKNGNEDMPIMFASTSKITFPGAGVAAMAASDKMIEIIKTRLKVQAIGPDKINQLRHIEFLPDVKAVKNQMKKQAEILRPKFDAVLNEFDKTLKNLDIAKWQNPKGGYFISLFVKKGCAKRVGELCKEAGLTLTNVGATYPHGFDPDDSNIRIAPSYPSLEDITAAAKVLSCAVRYATLESIL